jgi:hypothetical protein
MENLFARCTLTLATSLGVVAIATGCASPVPPSPAQDVVHDADVLDCSADLLGDLGPLDVAVAIDTSISSLGPSGVDIDGDGSIGVIDGSAYTDLGDSRLSAHVAALRSLVHNASEHDIRFSIVTFSRSNVGASTVQRSSGVVSNREARIRSPLSSDLANLDSALDEVLEDGAKGSTNFYAGMRGANRSLIESEDPGRESRKVVLFMSDSPETTRLEVDGTIKKYDERMARAARQALRHQIVFNTFGLSADSANWRRRSLGQIAGATSGSYHGVEDPRRLYCHLASSLASAARGSSEEL